MTTKHKKSIYICEESKQNFGDAINKQIIEKVSNERIVSNPINKCDLVGIGSVLNEFFHKKSKQNPFIWSSGFIKPFEKNKVKSKFKLKEIPTFRRGKSH